MRLAVERSCWWRFALTDLPSSLQQMWTMQSCMARSVARARARSMRRCTAARGATVPGRGWSRAVVSKMRRHLDQVDQIRYHVIRRDLVRHGRWASARPSGHADGAALGDARRFGVRWCGVASRVMSNIIRSPNREESKKRTRCFPLPPDTPVDVTVDTGHSQHGERTDRTTHPPIQARAAGLPQSAVGEV